jgi:Mg/Co/Ni transporter MgtE
VPVLDRERHLVGRLSIEDLVFARRAHVEELLKE